MRFNVFLPRSAWRFLGPTCVFQASVGPSEGCPDEPLLAEPAMSLRGVSAPHGSCHRVTMELDVSRSHN